MQEMNIDEEKHKDAVKIDAMFFATTEEPMVLIGDKLKSGNSIKDENDFHPIQENGSKEHSALIKNERRYLDMDTFILCNPNAMSY